ncbi:MAG: hypothetical protein GY930_04340 [bacterium]|nr:hypothetical protein [bacterium]
MNKDHLDIVRKGTEAVAEWNSCHPLETLDLEDADLEKARLEGVHLLRT